MSKPAREIRVGCSGWYYWHWRGVVYPEDLPTRRWFEHYQRSFDTVELNAPFYHWPRPSTVQNWARAARPGFRYSLKVNQTITHLKRFRGTRQLIRDFYELAAPLGEHLGCFLFQLPPSFRYTADAVYVRFHGASRWYAHDYSDAELKAWAEKIRASGAREIWAYFNNDREGCAFRNAQVLRRLLTRARKMG